MASKKTPNELVQVMYRHTRTGTYEPPDMQNSRAKSAKWEGPFKIKVITDPRTNIVTYQRMDEPVGADDLSGGMPEVTKEKDPTLDTNF